MPKYRKKPVVIEARQYWHHGDQAEAITKWSGGERSEHGLIIPTLEGDHLANDGDWVIQGIKGEFYPCKPDIFKETYEDA